jgi:hypothetical protein
MINRLDRPSQNLFHSFHPPYTEKHLTLEVRRVSAGARELTKHWWL